MRFRYVFILTFLCLCSQYTVGQNLVSNPGFELYLKDTYDSGLDQCRYWYKPTEGSTDYFHEKFKKTLRSPYKASEGNAFAGFYALNTKEEREYLAIKFLFPLREGFIYRFNFQLRYLADSSTVSPDFLHLLLTPDPLMDREEQEMKGLTPSNSISTTKVGNDWTKVEVEYQAKGGERFLCIGRFGKSGTGDCYYLIDDVGCYKDRQAPTRIQANLRNVDFDELTEEGEAEEEAKKATPVKSIPEKRVEEFVLEHILFESGRAIMKEDSYESLDQLANRLRNIDNYDVEITGHTDNVGDEAENQALSAERAKAVSDYLIKKGVPAENLRTSGQGSSQPKYDNTTEEGRSGNRRVECRISYRE